MDVTRSNFREACKHFDIALDKCEFITIDCEFTGVSTEFSKILPYDTPDQAFRKYSDNTSGYIVIQLGVTLLQPPLINSTDDTFIYNSYNFYVYPRGWRTNFLCQGSSISFLAENGFDFTKLFREGVSYCNEQEEAVLRDRLRERQKMREETRRKAGEATHNTSLNHIPVPDEEKEAIDKIQKEIEEFVNSADDEKIIGGCNGFQRKLIYELIEAKFADKVAATTQNVDNSKSIVVHRRKSKEEEDRIEEELKKSELGELEDNIGISKILQKISASRKPIIGHNMFLDLIFILRQFFRPLPESLVEFKKFATSIFPNVIDTKYLCSLPNVKSVINSSILLDIVQTISKPPFPVLTLEAENSDYSYSVDNNKAHEAGYDSYLTALSFLAIVNHIHGSINVILNDMSEAKEYLNRIFLTKLPDVGYLNLVGVEPIPCRDHVFHVKVPEDWRQSDLVHQFRNYGPIFVTWINASSALISLHKKENSGSVLKTIGSCEGFKVQSFNAFKETLEQRLNGSESSTPKHPRKRKLSEDDNTGKESKSPKKKTRKSSPEVNTSQKYSKETTGKKESKHQVKGFKESDDW